MTDFRPELDYPDEKQHREAEKEKDTYDFNNRYIEDRKRLLKEMAQLTYNKVNINKRIKRITEEMRALDNQLLLNIGE